MISDKKNYRNCTNRPMINFIILTAIIERNENRIIKTVYTQMKYLKSLLYMLRNAKTGFLQCIGYPSFIKDRIKLGSLQILALVQLQDFQNY